MKADQRHIIGRLATGDVAPRINDPLAQRYAGMDELQMLAQVVLELADKVDNPMFAVPASAEATFASIMDAQASATATATALDNIGSIEVSAIALEATALRAVEVADIIEGMLKDPDMARISKRQFATIAADRILSG